LSRKDDRLVNIWVLDRVIIVEYQHHGRGKAGELVDQRHEDALNGDGWRTEGG
jgi:hypothetical protein